MENRQLREENKYLQDVLEGNITEIRQDITDLRIHQGHSDAVIEGKDLITYFSFTNYFEG